jgi:hypothetical protein
MTSEAASFGFNRELDLVRELGVLGLEGVESTPQILEDGFRCHPLRETNVHIKGAEVGNVVRPA